MIRNISSIMFPFFELFAVAVFFSLNLNQVAAYTFLLLLLYELFSLEKLLYHPLKARNRADFCFTSSGIINAQVSLFSTSIHTAPSVERTPSAFLPNFNTGLTIRSFEFLQIIKKFKS